MKEYCGFEVGPIRPPSEANSLLIRITRNCPWNRCTFCTLYKDDQFSMRAVEDVYRDLDQIKECIDMLKASETMDSDSRSSAIKRVREQFSGNGNWVYAMSYSWFKNGMESIFLQDANSMVIKPENMTNVLNYIRKLFPEVKRVTIYARSKTIAAISDEDLQKIADAGLNRIHIGMESASDIVLEKVKKGVDKKTHILAGQKIMRAGIELSEYFMPGLGGREYSRLNAQETADALNQINPSFIRIRTLSITPNSELEADYKNGVFTRTNDVDMVKELYQLVDSLDGITSYIKSDHIINLLPEVEGKLPQDKERILSTMRWFLELSREDQDIFRVGRRTMTIHNRDDFENPKLRDLVVEHMRAQNITSGNIDERIDRMLTQFI